MKSPNLFPLFFISSVQYSAYLEQFYRTYNIQKTRHCNTLKIFTAVYHSSHSLNECRPTLPLSTEGTKEPKRRKKVSFSHFIHKTLKLAVYITNVLRSFLNWIVFRTPPLYMFTRIWPIVFFFKLIHRCNILRQNDNDITVRW